jgi:hypothetical protein
MEEGYQEQQDADDTNDVPATISRQQKRAAYLDIRKRREEIT